MGCSQSKSSNTPDTSPIPVHVPRDAVARTRSHSRSVSSVESDDDFSGKKRRKKRKGKKKEKDTTQHLRESRDEHTRFSRSYDFSVLSEGYIFQAEDECRELFDRYDTSNDGRINRSELEKTLGVGNNVARLILCQIGRDDEKGVSYEEFRRFYELSDPRTPTSVKIKLLFEGIDLNGDGKVDEEEVANYLSSITPGSAPDQFKEFAVEIVRGRENKDALVLDDFAAMREEFKMALKNVERLGELLREHQNRESLDSEGEKEDKEESQ